MAFSVITEIHCPYVIIESVKLSLREQLWLLKNQFENRKVSLLTEPKDKWCHSYLTLIAVQTYLECKNLYNTVEKFTKIMYMTDWLNNFWLLFLNFFSDKYSMRWGYVLSSIVGSQTRLHSSATFLPSVLLCWADSHHKKRTSNNHKHSNNKPATKPKYCTCGRHFCLFLCVVGNVDRAWSIFKFILATLYIACTVIETL